MKFWSLSLLLVTAEAVSFSAYGGQQCRGQQVVAQKGTTPYTCYYIGSASSIEAQGLQNRGLDEYDTYTDMNCKAQSGTIKYNDLCQNYNFVSVAYIPPTVGSRKEDIELNFPPLDSLDSLSQEILLKADGLMVPTETMESWGRYSNKSAPVKRNPGDRHDYDGVTAIDNADDNSEMTDSFSFANRANQSSFASVLLRRFRSARDHGALLEFQDQQTVQDPSGNTRDLQVDIQPAQGTLNMIPDDQVTAALTLFLRYRNTDGHNVFQFFATQGGTALFTLTFKAII